MAKNEYFDFYRFRELLRKAIGDRTQKAFAEIAGLSPYHLTRLLNNDEIATPEKRTLKKIADASEGRVTEVQLLYACGYIKHDGTNDGKNMTEEEKCRFIADRMVEALRVAAGTPNKYSRIKDALETVALACNPDRTYFVLDEERDYEGAGRNGAENMVCCTAKWTSGDWLNSGPAYDSYLSFVVYFCKTAKGGYILSDIAFDLNTLVDERHPEAGKFLFEKSEKGDVNYADYPIVFSCRNHVPGEAERRLLRAIFGEIEEEE